MKLPSIKTTLIMFVIVAFTDLSCENFHEDLAKIKKGKDRAFAGEINN